MEFVKEVLTVREAILLCISYNIKGSDKQLESYDNSKPNRIRGDQINALKGNLECIYDNVEITGGGKRGKVVVSGLKNTVTEKDDKRSTNEGQPQSTEQLIMNNYLHNKLYSMYKNKDKMEYGLNGWTKALNLIDINESRTSQLEGCIVKAHKYTKFTIFNPSQIVKEFKDAIYSMNTGIVEKGFKYLSRTNKIKYHLSFNMVNSNGENETLDKCKYNKIKNRRMEALSELDSSITEYFNAINSPAKTKRMMSIVDEVANVLDKEFKCKFIYQTYTVDFVDDDFNIVNEEEFTNAYWKEFIKRTERRQRFYDNKYKDDTWLWRKLWAYNTFTLLYYMNIDVAGLVLQYEMENANRVNELSIAYQKYMDKDKPIEFSTFTNENYDYVEGNLPFNF